MRARCSTSEMPVVLAGDFNVIPEPVDAKRPEAWTRRRAVSAGKPRGASHGLSTSGSTDAVRACHPEPGVYTFWDYQAGAWQKDDGIRIDHLLLSPEAADRLRGRRCRPHDARLGEAVGPRASLGRAQRKLSLARPAARDAAFSVQGPEATVSTSRSLGPAAAP